MSRRHKVKRARMAPVAMVPAPQASALRGFEGWTPLRPGQPMAPQYVGGSGARADIPQGWNISYQPRGEDGRLPPFGIIEGLAESNDVLRACIAQVTNQLVALDWSVTIADPDDAQNTLLQDIAGLVEDFFRKPNRIDGFSWTQWLKPLLFEALVTDAVAIQPEFDRIGRIHSFVQIDGKTIKPLTNTAGHRPQPPDAAFQQIIRGRVEAEFLAALPGSKNPGQLYYRASNPRKDSPYGTSPTEWVMTHILTGIKRWAVGLEFYNENTLPAVYVETPESSTPDQAREWHDLLNDVVAAETGKRFKFLPLPPGANVRDVKSPVWSREQDEWIARVIMFAFGVNPLPLVSQMNRATAETAEAIQYDSGLQPVKQNIAEILNDLIGIGWGSHVAEKIRFGFVTDRTDVSSARAAVLETYQRNGWMWAWEIRENILGLDSDDGVRALPLGVIQPPAAGAAPLMLPAGETDPGNLPEIPDSSGPVAVAPESALNSAQVTAATAIVQQVASGIIPRDSGIGQLIVLFNLSPEQAEQIMGSAGRDVETTPNPKPANAGDPAPLAPPDPAGHGDGEAVVNRAALDDLARWARVVRKSGRDSSKALGFRSDSIPPETMEGVKAGLQVAEDDDDVVTLFALARRARPLKREGEPGVQKAQLRLARAVSAVLDEQWQRIVDAGAASLDEGDDAA